MRMISEWLIPKTVRQLLLLCGFVWFQSVARAADYIADTRQHAETAVAISDILDTYEKWLPLAILVHFPQAEQELENFHQKIIREKSKLGLGIYYLNKAYLLTENEGDYTKGLENCLEAQRIFEELDARPQLVMTYNRLAFIILWNEIARKKPVIAVNILDTYLMKALRISRELQNRELELLSLAFIGSYFNVTENDNEKALSYFFEAEKKMDAKTRPELRLVILESIAIVYSDMKKENGALLYGAKAKAEPFFAQYGYGRSNMYRSYAKMYTALAGAGNLEKALFYADSAYAISLQMHAPAYVSLGAERLYEVYKARGNDKEALLFHERYKNADDSINRERLQKTFTGYDLVKKENTIIRQRLWLQQKNYLLYGSSALFLLVLTAAWIIFKQYKRRQQSQLELYLQQEKRKAEKAIADAEENERKRISADLHDNLGVYAASLMSNLSYLNFSDLQEQNRQAFSRLQENASYIISGLNDTIWVLRKEAQSLTSISDRIKQFAAMAGKNYPAITIQQEEEIQTDPVLPVAQAYNLYRIIQEAVANALRHSGADTITIRFFAATGWKVRIEDNGKGMSPETGSKGYGLANMKARSETFGWSIQWRPATPRGTVVEIGSPTTN